MQFLLRQRRRRVAVTLVAVALLAGLIVADRSGWLLYAGDEVGEYDGRTFRVVRVIDGDTLDVAVPDGASPTTRIRLWGIDTPERARPNEGLAAQPFAEEATEMARRLAEGRDVLLMLEPHRVRGEYGRVLAYVTLPDGSMLNELLLLAGMARADNRWAHRHARRFELLQLQAQRQRLGVWSDGGGDEENP